jgi:hypothetical protein
MDLIWAMWKAIYFCAKDWTGSISLRGFHKSHFSRIEVGPSLHIVRLAHSGVSGSKRKSTAGLAQSDRSTMIPNRTFRSVQVAAVPPASRKSLSR